MPIRCRSTILEYVVECMHLNNCAIGDSFEFNVDSNPVDKHHNIIVIVPWRESDLGVGVSYPQFRDRRKEGT